ncbi:bL21 family ribosomal protein [Patescibacteria group bacterium]|nr:bL21 family ribosomal protein [Patescibacteria group bacterium]
MDIKKLAVLEKNNEQILVKEGETFYFRTSDSKDTNFNVLLILEDEKVVIGEPFIEKNGVIVEFVGEKKLKTETRRYRNKSRYRRNKSHTDIFFEYKVVQISTVEKEVTKKAKSTEKPVKKVAKKATVKKLIKKSK